MEYFKDYELGNISDNWSNLKQIIIDITSEYDYICRVISNYFNIPIRTMLSRSRKREHVQPRQISMFFHKKLTKLSLAEIGRQTGNFDHATALSGIRTINNLIATDKDFKRQIEEIEILLK